MTTQAKDGSQRDWWLEKGHYLRSWDKRAKAVAGFCGDGFVCDIGCGMMGLNRYLPLRARYLPADLRQWTPGVELCDLNAKRLPEKYLALADTVTLLGVVERIDDLDWLFATLATRAERLVVTYHCADKAPKRLDWTNAYTTEEFTAKLVNAGWEIAHVEMFRDQTIFVAQSKLFTEEQKQARKVVQDTSTLAPSRATLARRLLAKVIG
jgi:hypothetical protein